VNDDPPPTRLPQHSKVVRQLLDSLEIPHYARDFESGIFQINGYACRVGSPYHPPPPTFKINVNTRWFADNGNTDLPRYPNLGYDIHFYLFAIDGTLLGLNWLKVRRCALRLENDITRFHNDPNWGLVIERADQNYRFHWKENTLRFPMDKITRLSDFTL
jgi:hypothetical protein